MKADESYVTTNLKADENYVRCRCSHKVAEIWQMTLLLNLLTVIVTRIFCCCCFVLSCVLNPVKFKKGCDADVFLESTFAYNNNKNGAGPWISLFDVAKNGKTRIL